MCERSLQEALTGLNNAEHPGARRIKSIRAAQGIDPVSITPSAEMLGDPQNYEIVVEPPVGQLVDANNPVFTLTVRAHFSALATPSDQLVGQQLQGVIPEHFRANLPCKAGEQLGFPLDRLSLGWAEADGRWRDHLYARPEPGARVDQPAEARRLLANRAPRPQQSLDALQQEGLIAGYTLPRVESTFPSFDFLLTRRAGPARPARPAAH